MARPTGVAPVAQMYAHSTFAIGENTCRALHCSAAAKKNNPERFDLMSKATVTVRRLASPHQEESFMQFLPLNDALKAEIFEAVAEIFDAAGGRALLKSSGDVYLKPNAVDCKAYAYTRPEVIEAVARYWRDNGARDI